MRRSSVRRRKNRRKKGKAENRKAGFGPSFCVVYHARVSFWGEMRSKLE